MLCFTYWLAAVEGRGRWAPFRQRHDFLAHATTDLGPGRERRRRRSTRAARGPSLPDESWLGSLSQTVKPAAFPSPAPVASESPGASVGASI